MAKKNKIKAVLNYHIWSDDIHLKILDDIVTYAPKVINIFAAEEHEINNIWSSPNGFFPYKRAFIDNNIEVNFIFGAAHMDFYQDRYNFPEYNIRTILWPTYFLCFTLSSIRHSAYHLRHHDHTSKYTYPFISMNNRPHRHRCMFLDQMARADLLDLGAVSWHNDNEIPYNWEWWDHPTRLTLTDQFETLGNSYALPAEWDVSFLNVVSECSINRTYFSEKTWIPLLCLKPFLSQSNTGFYKTFTELGFVLYDEIFDYSFDEEADDAIRTEMIMNNVKKIIGRDYQEMYNMLLPKLTHNFLKAIEIATSENFIPDIVKNSEYAMLKYTALRDMKNISYKDMQNLEIR